MCVRNFFRASSRHCASSATKKQTSDWIEPPFYR
jgi:hypothetical protein